jgi:signal transduction histidine kinase
MNTRRRASGEGGADNSGRANAPRPRAAGRAAGAQRPVVRESGLELLVAELSTAVIRATPDEVDGEVERWLARLVEVVGIDRASILQVPPEGHALVVTHTFGVDGIPPNPPIVLESEFPWYVKQGGQGRTLRLERIPEDLPPEAVAERAYVQATGLKSHLGIPINVSGRLLGGVGLFTFGTYRAWPEPLVQQLQRAAELVGTALARKEAHQALEERLAFERLIADLVQSFVNAPADQLDARIHEGLQRVVGHFGVERISFGQFSADGSALVTHQAQVCGTPETPSNITLPGYHGELLKGRIVQFSRIPDDVPDGWASERAALAGTGIRSILGIPLAVGGRVWGAIAFAALSRPQEWTDDEIQRLGLLGRIMMEAVLRRESERDERQTRHALAERVAFEDLLTELSAAFVAVPSAGVNDEIDRWLRQLAEFLGVDRCSLLQQAPDEAVLHMTHSHAGVKAPPVPTVLSRNEFPWYMMEVARGQMIRLEGLPEGLPPQADRERVHARKTGLGALLVLPFSFGAAPLGALAFASGARRHWPDALVNRLQLVAQVFASALGRRRARGLLEESLGFERLITDLVKTFVSVPGDRLDAEIESGLSQLIGHFGVERATLARLSEDGKRLIGTHMARENGVPASPVMLDFPWYVGQLRAARIIQVSNLSEDLPPEATGEHQIALETGLRSHLGIPLVADGRTWGTIGFSSFGSPRRWTDEQAHRLRLVGEIMMEAVKRHEAADAARRQRDELAHVARVAALGELTAALAHELNQPLAAIHTNAQATRRLLAAGRAPDDLDEVFGDIAAAAARAADLIRRLRNLLQRRQLEKVPLAVNEMLRDVQPILVTEAGRHGCRLTCHLAEALPMVAGDAVQLQQVVLNLARNAAEAMGAVAAAQREVVVRTADFGDGQVTVSVEDSGPPIDDASLATMFTPFHTTKPDGLGIGLAISRSIIEAHGGRLWAEPRHWTGMAVQFTLPASREG